MLLLLRSLGTATSQNMLSLCSKDHILMLHPIFKPGKRGLYLLTLSLTVKQVMFWLGMKGIKIFEILKMTL